MKGIVKPASKPLVVIPAFNEALVIKKTFAELSKYPQYDYLYVDDGSTDETAEILNKLGANFLSLPFNLGVGVAMRTGFSYALKNNYKAVIQFDADLQHKPEYISELVSSLNDADVVVGSRFAGGNIYRVSFLRKIAMNILRFAVSRHSGEKLTDVTSGFRAAGDKAIQIFAEDYPAEYLADTVESLILAADRNLKIKEIPVVMQTRQGGQPSQNLIRSTFYLGRSFLVLIAS
ncbi:MAG: glycosyltransferase family 2 protein, partial [Candidatus Nanopelagicales bacterium]